jgi:NAD(P)-dependent dehydrogenase (short-subunit alcohol dehydrogenase family)
VVFAARSLSKLEAEAERARSAGGSALAVELDVTSDASVERAVAQALAHFGRIDVLINDAGNGGSVQLWASSDPALTRQMFEVHVLGAERMMRALVPAMRVQGGGVIVNFASTVAWVPMPGAAAYSSAKAAVVALSLSLRAELAQHGIDVRVFAPPHTSTEAGKAWPLPLPKIFEPEWVAEQLVRALRGKRARVIPGGNGSLLFMQRVSPALAAWIMNGIGWKTLQRSA